VNNRPSMLIDPSGHLACEHWDSVGNCVRDKEYYKHEPKLDIGANSNDSDEDIPLPKPLYNGKSAAIWAITHWQEISIYDEKLQAQVNFCTAACTQFISYALWMGGDLPLSDGWSPIASCDFRTSWNFTDALYSYLTNDLSLANKKITSEEYEQYFSTNTVPTGSVVFYSDGSWHETNTKGEFFYYWHAAITTGNLITGTSIPEVIDMSNTFSPGLHGITDTSVPYDIYIVFPSPEN